jgi:hypothetical protein
VWRWFRCGVEVQATVNNSPIVGKWTGAEATPANIRSYVGDTEKNARRNVRYRSERLEVESVVCTGFEKLEL